MGARGVRYAVYLTPASASRLAGAAETWLGRSAFTGAVGEPLAPAAANVAVPARYGFHATLKAPFRLRAGATEAELVAAFRSFAARLPPLEVPLEVSRLGRFVALTARNHAPVAAVCDAAVRAFEPFRAPLSEAERDRRRPERLDRRERELLHAWGYPHVFDRFLFHMTLTGPVDEAAIGDVEAAVRSTFAPLLATSHTLFHALFREAESGFAIIALETVDAPS